MNRSNNRFRQTVSARLAGRSPAWLRASLLAASAWLSLAAQAQTGPGYALDFNGINQYVSVPSSTNLNLGSQFTIELWIYQTNALPANGYRLVDKETASTQDGYLLDTYDGVTGRKLRMAFGGGGWYSTTPYTLNAWHHVAVTYNAGTLSFYLDGDAAGVTSGVPAPAGNSLDFRIGAPHAGCSGSCGLVEYFSGAIDEVRIWNVARTQAQIQANMNRSLSPPQGNLVAYWRFDEGTASYAYDSSGQGQTGTLVNNPIWVSSTYPFVPAVVTLPAGPITNGTVTFNATVNPNGSPTSAWFQWGAGTNYGSNTFAMNLGSGTTNVPVEATLSGLLAGNSYHYSIVASNAAGLATGADQVLTVPPITLEFVPGKFGVINLIPEDLSGETGQNSEPSFCFGINDRYFELVAHAFSAGLTNDYYTSQTFSSAWSRSGAIFDHDATMDWSPAGTCYAAIIPNLTQISVLQSSEPVRGVGFSAISTITRGSCPDRAHCLIPDQPRVRVANVDNVDHIFVGFNDLSRVLQSDYKTATVRYSLDGGSTWKETVIEKTSPGVGQDSPAVPVAISNGGKTVYALFQRWKSSSGDDYVGDVVLVRDDEYGDGGFGALGNGTLVGYDAVLPHATTLGGQAIISACDLAVNPSDGSQVYAAYTALVSGEPPHVRLCRSLDSGAHFSVVDEFYGSLPALAVAADGTVGVLSAFVGWNLTDFEIAFTKYLGGSFASDMKRVKILQRFPMSEVSSSFVGDYFTLRALNDNFYGAFCGSGAPNFDHFPSGAYFQRRVMLSDGTIQQNSMLPATADQLVDTFGTRVAPSMDPYFFYDIAPYFREVPQISLVGPGIYAGDPMSGITHLAWPGLPPPEPQFALLGSSSLGQGAAWRPATNSTILNTNGQFVATFFGPQPQQYYRLERSLTNVQFPLFTGAGAHGALSPSGLLTNLAYTSRTFTATPANNYALAGWYLDGELVQSNGASFTVSNITSDHTLIATFAASNDLAVTVFELPEDDGPAQTSSTNQYEIHIENKGLNSLTTILMTNYLPANATFVSASTSKGSVSQLAGTVNGYIDALAPGEAAAVLIRFAPTSAGTLTDTVYVACSQPEPDLSNNSATNVTTAIDPVDIVSQPAPQSVAAGGTASFSVGASGTPPFTYEWFFNATNLIAVSTNSTLTMTNVAPAQAGSYSVTVFQILGPESFVGLTSTNAELTVH